MIDEAAGEVLEDAGAEVQFAEELASRVGCDITAVETGHDFASNGLREREGRGGTLCLHEAAADLRGYKLLLEQSLIAEAAASSYLVMRHPG